MAPAKAKAPPAPKGQTYMLLMMMLMLFILVDPSLSAALGAGMSVVLNPTIGFSGQLPVVSILLAGALTGVLSTGLRHWSSDYIALERSRLLQRSFQRVMNEARIKRDVDRMGRLKRAQPFVMSHTMEANYATMKPAVGTMVVALAVFGWLNVFLRTEVPISSVSLPWSSSWPLHASWGFPYWVVLYMVMSLPLTLVISATLKLWRYRNFDPSLPLKPLPTVDDLIRRAEGEAEDEDSVAREAERAKRRLKGAAAPEGEGEEDGEPTIVEGEEGEVAIVEPEGEEAEGGEAGGDGSARAGAAPARGAPAPEPKRRGLLRARLAKGDDDVRLDAPPK